LQLIIYSNDILFGFTFDSITLFTTNFNPKFTLGMTATPERSDNNSIFDLFDNNVALEVRLHEAL
jgi:superfamily II DNA or RNA helicase